MSATINKPWRDVTWRYATKKKKYGKPGLSKRRGYQTTRFWQKVKCCFFTQFGIKFGTEIARFGIVVLARWILKWDWKSTRRRDLCLVQAFILMSAFPPIDISAAGDRVYPSSSTHPIREYQMNICKNPREFAYTWKDAHSCSSYV